ncbi:ArpU family phage packaging/lysis transcriptional regulator [Sporohalobacter salinus]|uniref:ArpU family phage packaging/lysis transcriptional regulator n=1 Tax=Sporohalobacter salinus TaxID=1494606 RepID=UPI00195F2E13|nr:ArpU family phage packaging/lysis transcriptional regulator [Sporohalobacter salinus]MBM7623654.1 ArpU family phage transcriptional regulator [Sporohalobacter salinus]
MANTKRKSDWYSKVVNHLLNYQEYKQRIEILKYKLDNKLETSAYSCSPGGSSKTNDIFDSTFEKVIDRLESDEAKEFREKSDIVNMIDIALNGLDSLEEYVIKRKYITGRNISDVEIYSDLDFGYSRQKYYDVKDEAIAKIARILGYV